MNILTELTKVHYIVPDKVRDALEKMGPAARAIIRQKLSVNPETHPLCAVRKCSRCEFSDGCYIPETNPEKKQRVLDLLPNIDWDRIRVSRPSALKPMELKRVLVVDADLKDLSFRFCKTVTDLKELRKVYGSRRVVVRRRGGTEVRVC